MPLDNSPPQKTSNGGDKSKTFKEIININNDLGVIQSYPSSVSKNSADSQDFKNLDDKKEDLIDKEEAKPTKKVNFNLKIDTL